MFRLVFSVGLVLAVCALWPDRGHSRGIESAQIEGQGLPYLAAAEDVACAERKADATEARAKAKTRPRRKAKQPQRKAPAGTGVSPETMRRLDELLLLDAVRGAARR